MDYVQLDKNTGDKRLRDACLRQGIVGCELLPREIRDADDDIVLDYVFEKQCVLFTFDRRIHFQWGSVLAGRNPGILILRKDDDSLEQINTKTAPRHLQQFKTDFPAWHSVSFRNSVLEVTPKYVFLYQTRTETPVRTWWCERLAAPWQDELFQKLAINAASG